MKFYKSIKDYLPGLIIALIFLIFNLITINDYGITWDEPTHFNDGMAILNYLKGKTDKLEIKNEAYGQISPLLSALSYSIFYGKLGFLPYDSALHLPNIFLAALAIFILYFLGNKLFNKNIAFWSALFLAVYPRFIGMTHQNIKDLPVITFYCLAVYFFYIFLTKITFFYGFLAGLFFGLAINIKINAVFLPLIFIIWVIMIGFPKKGKIKLDKAFFLSISAFILSSILFTYIFRPAMWSNPLKNIMETYTFYKDVWRGGSVLYFGKLYKSGVNVPWHYSWVYFLIVTPIIMLVFFFMAIINHLVKKDFSINFILICLWFLLPLVRYFSSKTIILDDIRHFIEIIPAACLIGGVGIDEFITLFRKQKKIIMICLFILISLFFINDISKIHPYESIYFNRLIGGVGAASGKFDIDYWGFSIKEGSGWLNKNAAIRSVIYVHSAGIVAPIYLRHDLRVTQRIKEANYLMIINRPSDFSPTIYDWVSNKVPVHKIEKEGGVLLYIFKTNRKLNKL